VRTSLELWKEFEWLRSEVVSILADTQSALAVILNGTSRRDLIPKIVEAGAEDCTETTTINVKRLETQCPKHFASSMRIRQK
jgi:hypothetical protein